MRWAYVPLSTSGGDSKSSTPISLGRSRALVPPGTAFFAASVGLYRRAGSHTLPPSRLAGGCSSATTLTPRVRSCAGLQSGHATVIRRVRYAPGRTSTSCWPQEASTRASASLPTLRRAQGGRRPDRPFPRVWGRRLPAVVRRVPHGPSCSDPAARGGDPGRGRGPLRPVAVPRFTGLGSPRLPPPRPRTAVLHSDQFGVVALVHPSAPMSHFIGEAMRRR